MYVEKHINVNRISSILINQTWTLWQIYRKITVNTIIFSTNEISPWKLWRISWWVHACLIFQAGSGSCRARFLLRVSSHRQCLRQRFWADVHHARHSLHTPFLVRHACSFVLNSYGCWSFTSFQGRSSFSLWCRFTVLYFIFPACSISRIEFPNKFIHYCDDHFMRYGWVKAHDISFCDVGTIISAPVTPCKPSATCRDAWSHNGWNRRV